MEFRASSLLTQEQAKANNEIGTKLVPGNYYTFTPPIKATALPTAGIVVSAPIAGTFYRGYYIKQAENEIYVFRGKPENDTRKITIPKGFGYALYALDRGELELQLRECYFHVLLFDGSVPVLDNEHNHS